jgi:phosphoribosyl 1,2-cyclic phosphodiesterase
VRVKFWGVRGSIPVPGRQTNRYGGNTSCVGVRIDGGPCIVIDAGTGIRRLGKELMLGEFGRGEGSAHLLVSHTHWDHIQGMPFFAPLYQRGNRLYVYARQRDDVHLREVFQSQTEDPYFPVPFDAVQADVAFRELLEGARFEIGPVKVACTRLNHPWIAMAYRLDHGGGSVCYVTDTAPFRDVLLEKEFVAEPPRIGEPLPPPILAKLRKMQEGLVRLCEGADLVIYDTMFTPEEYRRQPHWGHSCPDDAIEICLAAGAKTLALFHHAPERADDEVDTILSRYRQATSGLEIVAASEGLEIRLGR